MTGLLIGMMATLQMQAQSKFYVNVNGGYSIPFLAQPYGQSLNWYSQPINPTIDGETYYSKLGSGWNIGAIAGYTLNNYISLELGYMYQQSPEGNHNRFNFNENGFTTYLSTSTLQSKVHHIMPTLRLFKSYKSGQTFLRIAPIFGISRLYAQYVEQNFGPLTLMKTTESSVEFSGGMAYGMFLSVGYEHNLGDKFGLSIELFTNMQRYSPSKSTLTQYTVDGVDMLPNMTVSQKQREFVKNLPENYSVDSNPNEPSKNLISNQSSFTFSSVGLKLGLSYRF